MNNCPDLDNYSAKPVIGAEGLPEEGPEGQPRGVEDLLPSGALLLKDLSDGGLGEDAVEAQFGLGRRLLSQPMDLEPKPRCGRVSHRGPPGRWWGAEHPHHPASEVSDHPPSGPGAEGGGLPVRSNSRIRGIRVLGSLPYDFGTCHSSPAPFPLL